MEPLTPRQLAVLIAIHAGMTDKEIARALNISHHTVDTHRTQIYKKLGVKRAIMAVRAADKLNLIPRAVADPLP